MNGRYIVLEGIENCGKSTTSRALAGELRLNGFSVATTREPAGTPFGVKISKLFDLCKEELTPLAYLAMFTADRSVQMQLVKRLLKENDFVISDRCFASTWVYQHFLQGYDRQEVEHFCQLATEGLIPEKIFWLDISAEESQYRKIRNLVGSTIKHFDEAPLDKIDRMRQGYQAFKENNPELVVRVDGSLKPRF